MGFRRGGVEFAANPPNDGIGYLYPDGYLGKGQPFCSELAYLVSGSNLTE